jgi:transposase InsO family protein
LTEAILRIAARETRAGYRGVRRHLRRESWNVNLKQVHRIWKKEGLRAPPRARKKRRLGTSENGAQRLKWLPMLDEFTCECLSLVVKRSLTSNDVIATLEKIVNQRGAPEFIRSDNGPEFIAHAVKYWIARNGFKTLFIEPGSPWQNCYSESFNSRFRDEFLNVESFSSLLEAKVLSREHMDKYNHCRPHSSLGDMTPAEFAASWMRPPGCSQAPPAYDEFQAHSRQSEPVNNPMCLGLQSAERFSTLSLRPIVT